MKKILATVGAVALTTMSLVSPASATQDDGCRHYSWTGGPLEEGQIPPRAPGSDWQANTAQEPHNENKATWVTGPPGLHYTGEPGKANWFDYVCAPQPCPTVTVPGPTVTAIEPGPTVTATVPGPTVTATEPGPIVTVTAKPDPAPTVTVTAAGPTVTATATETAVVPGPTLTLAGPTATATETSTVTVPGPTSTVTFCPTTGVTTAGSPLANTGASNAIWTTIAGLIALFGGGYLALMASRKKGQHE